MNFSATFKSAQELMQSFGNWIQRNRGQTRLIDQMTTDSHCIVCGSAQSFPDSIEREASNCNYCFATWRNRIVVMMLSRGLGVRQTPLPNWQQDFSRIGVGFDDSPVLSSRLPKILRYTNSHLYEFPKLDLKNPPKEAIGCFDFAICSEVLEHVTGDPQTALDGLSMILKPKGFAVITVPMTSTHDEFYPDLQETLEVNLDFVKWVDNEGNLHINEKPEFHGGTGDVLSFRVFSKASLVQGLKNSGFTTFEDPIFDASLGVGKVDGHGAILAFK